MDNIDRIDKKIITAKAIGIEMQRFENVNNKRDKDSICFAHISKTEKHVYIPNSIKHCFDYGFRLDHANIAKDRDPWFDFFC